MCGDLLCRKYPTNVAQEVYNPTKGFYDDSKVTIVLNVAVVKGLSPEWSKYSKYDSKTVTGMVGINNQGKRTLPCVRIRRNAVLTGATCYMNSLLETLFHTNMLRVAVFNMPTETDDPVKGVALAVQVQAFNRAATSHNSA